MKKLLLVSVLSLLFPLNTALAYPYIPSEPFGSKNNPIQFQEVKTTEQIIQESQQRIHDAQQAANDTLNSILQNAVKNQVQLLQQGNTQYVPVYVPVVAVPTPTSQVAASDSCPSNALRFVKGGACICTSGYEWNSQKTECVQSREAYCKAQYGSFGVWTGKYTASGSPACECKEGYRLESTGSVVHCVFGLPTAAVPPRSHGFWLWLLGLFNF